MSEEKCQLQMFYGGIEKFCYDDARVVADLLTGLLCVSSRDANGSRVNVVTRVN